MNVNRVNPGDETSLGIAANKGLLVRGFSWLVANPFIFIVLLGQNDVGHIPEPVVPHHNRPTKINSP